GESTPTGVRAKILCAEIETALVNKFNSSPRIQPPAIPNEKLPEKPVEVTQPPAANPPPANPPAATKPAEPPQPKATAPADTARQRQAYDAIAGAMTKVKAFQYAEAKKDIETLIAGADGDAKKAMQGALELIQYETQLFERCHTRLKDDIAKDPQHESPLEVK